MWLNSNIEKLEPTDFAGRFGWPERRFTLKAMHFSQGLEVSSTEVWKLVD